MSSILGAVAITDSFELILVACEAGLAGCGCFAGALGGVDATGLAAGVAVAFAPGFAFAGFFAGAGLALAATFAGFGLGAALGLALAAGLGAAFLTASFFTDAFFSGAAEVADALAFASAALETPVSGSSFGVGAGLPFASGLVSAV
jgi:hypothetical protein